MYILEVQRYTCGGTFQHLGYVAILFSSKDKAARHYNTYNPHLRDLNEYGNWSSRMDPVTKLRAVVKKYNNELDNDNIILLDSAADLSTYRCETD